jgi:hypothetical protein
VPPFTIGVWKRTPSLNFDRAEVKEAGPVAYTLANKDPSWTFSDFTHPIMFTHIRKCFDWSVGVGCFPCAIQGDHLEFYDGSDGKYFGNPAADRCCTRFDALKKGSFIVLRDRS